MGFATIGGVILHYRIAGPANGKPLVFANSLGTDARIWDAVINRLPGQYRILSYDKRGHGLSDTPPGPYGLDDHVADLLGLADQLGMAEFALVGVSVGGMIGQAIGARHAERVKALVLCDTAAQIGTETSWNDRIDTVQRHGMAAMADAVIERWFTAAFRSGHPADLAGWRTMLLRADPQGYAATCATVRDADLSREVPSITRPTLVVVGAEDLATPPELVEATATLIPGARFEVISGAGHIPSIEQPEVLAGLIAGFLRENGYV